MQTSLLLHFLKFDIQSNSLDLSFWPEQLYEPNDLTRQFPVHRTTLTLQIENGDSDFALPIAPPQNGIFAETNLCTGKCFYENGRFYSSSETQFRHQMDFDVERNWLRANVGGAFLESGKNVVSNFLRPILQSFILPFSGLKTLHGAVLHKDGRTVFLSGGAGMGKSTTTLQLIRSGWDVLSDDGPFFFSNDGRAQVLSSLDHLHVTQNTLQMFPEMQPQVLGELDVREKYALRRRGLQRGEAWKSAHTITDFVELRRGDHAFPRLAAGDRAAVFRALFNDTMVVFRRVDPASSRLSARAYSAFIFQLVTDVLRGARVHRLEYANHHLAQIPQILETIS